MKAAKLKKYVNLALNNSSEAEASTSARMFFKKLRSLDRKFTPTTWGLTKAQAERLMTLGGVQIKGTKSPEDLIEKVRREVHGHNNADLDKVITLSELCKFYGMETSKARRILRKHFGAQNKRWSWTFGPELDEVRQILLKSK